MKFLIITSVNHKVNNGSYYGYDPYVREMNLWISHVHSVTIVAPLSSGKVSPMDSNYCHENISFKEIPAIRFTDFWHTCLSVLKMPLIMYEILKASRKADHIHLRCPGNIGLLGCLVQVLFPKKIKTAKYAGNWDPKSKQPISYRVQKRILSNTFLTKNMSALVYGNWKNQSKNIKPFFTASFSEIDKVSIKEKNYSKSLKFVFIGALLRGKQPLKTIKVIETLRKEGYNVTLDVFGEGKLKPILEAYIKDNKLSSIIKLNGAVSKEQIKKALLESHFSILLSKSEGWPKALAEAMFYGVIPIATKVSCVPWMLDNGGRGILVENDINETVRRIKYAIDNVDFVSMSKASREWSQHYTTELFTEEIRKLLN